MKGFFIAGIHTGAGKTLASAILVQALKADYWKPVQSGAADYTDADFVRDHAPSAGNIHPEAYKLAAPLSPHEAADREGKLISLRQINIPQTDNLLIVESAGGILSPLAAGLTMADLALHLELPVILVSMNYLGSINHTLLSAEALKNRNIPLAGIIFNGPVVPSTESYILETTGLTLLGRIEQADTADTGFILSQANAFTHLHELVGKR